MATVDWTDPCARAETLRQAYYRLLSGSQEASVNYSGNGVTRETRYVATDLSVLISEIRKAEEECALLQEQPAPRKRYAIQAGARRSIS